MHNSKYTDNQVLQMLASGSKTIENNAFQYLYKEYFGPIESFIVRNSGTIEDVPSIFNDTLLVLYKKINEPNFRIGCSGKGTFKSAGESL